MQLAYIIFVVPDVLSTVTFYEQAFGLKQRFIDDSKKYCEMETGQTRLAFVAEDAARTVIPVEFAPGPRHHHSAHGHRFHDRRCRCRLQTCRRIRRKSDQRPRKKALGPNRFLCPRQ